AVSTERTEEPSSTGFEIESSVAMTAIEPPVQLGKRSTSPTEPLMAENQTDDRPFDVRILEYKELADTGDADAACRLVRALDKCASILGSRFDGDDALIRLLANADLNEAAYRETSAKLASTLG